MGSVERKAETKRGPRAGRRVQAERRPDGARTACQAGKTLSALQRSGESGRVEAHPIVFDLKNQLLIVEADADANLCRPAMPDSIVNRLLE